MAGPAGSGRRLKKAHLLRCACPIRYNVLTRTPPLTDHPGLVYGLLIRLHSGTACCVERKEVNVEVIQAVNARQY
jgi:hypothetical protein